MNEYVDNFLSDAMQKRFIEHESGFLEVLPGSWGHGSILIAGYAGPSMNPTLRQGDMLEVLPHEGRPVRAGDVIIFRSPGRGYVVHRIVALSEAGAYTRGDNNSAADSYIVQPGDIVGRVVAACRGASRRAVAGGLRGQVRGGLLLLIRAVRGYVFFVLRRPYHRIARTGIVQKLLPKSWRPRCIEAVMPQCRQLHLVIRGKVVGSFDNRRKTWRIAKPYRIFVDEASLPRL